MGASESKTATTNGLPRYESWTNAEHAHRALPSPQEVRERAISDGIDITKTFRPEPVRFPEQTLIVKWGSDVTVAEAQCLWFIREHLEREVLVPRVYGWRQDNGQAFIYMELIDGATLAEEWGHLQRCDKVAICQSLGQMIRAWRRIKRSDSGAPYVEPMPSLYTMIMSLLSSGWTQSKAGNHAVGISQIDGSGLRDMMFYDAGVYPLGPFADISAFHDCIAQLAVRHPKGQCDARKSIGELAGLDDNVPAVFTHNDLNMNNILVSPRGEEPCRILAIIDWHQSGWYPEPWEGLKANVVSEPGSEWKEEYLPRIFPTIEPTYAYAWEYISMSAI